MTSIFSKISILMIAMLAFGRAHAAGPGNVRYVQLVYRGVDEGTDALVHAVLQYFRHLETGSTTDGPRPYILDHRYLVHFRNFDSDAKDVVVGRLREVLGDDRTNAPYRLGASAWLGITSLDLEAMTLWTARQRERETPDELLTRTCEAVLLAERIPGAHQAN